MYWQLEQDSFGRGDNLKRHDLENGRTINVVPGAIGLGAVATDERHVYWMANKRVARQTHDAVYEAP